MSNDKTAAEKAFDGLQARSMSFVRSWQPSKHRRVEQEANAHNFACLICSKKDKAFVKRKAVLKKIIAGMTMGIDMSSLFPDIVGCLVVQQLEIKKMC